MLCGVDGGSAVVAILCSGAMSASRRRETRAGKNAPARRSSPRCKEKFLFFLRGFTSRLRFLWQVVIASKEIITNGG